MFSLSDKNALITGATGGIGYDIAKKFLEQGANVALSGTREAVLESIKTDLEKEFPNQKVVILPCNLSSSDDVEALYGKAEEALGAIHVLVNNAGITRDGLVMRMKNEDWDAVMKVNLEAAFKLCRSAVKSMMRQRAGSIINISSVVGTAGNPGQANYCASKAGLIGMSKAMAHEVASRGITVNAIAPGFIETEMTAKLNDKQKESILSNIPARKMGKPSDIAAAAVYLASDAGSYVNGQTIHVNGGMYMV